MILAFDWQDNGFAGQFIAGMARRLVRSMRSASYGPDDIEQELAVQLWQQRDRFDENRGSWEAFVTNVVRTSAIKLIRHVRAAKRDDRLTVSLLRDNASSPTVNSDLRMDLATAIRQLSRPQKRFLAAIGTGPRDEVRAALGISRRKFDSRKKSLKRTLSSMHLDEYCC